MHAFRICRRPFADLSGEGARLHGGRWNTPGRPMVYAAESVALVVLEVRVLDLPWEPLPFDYVLLTIDAGGCSAEAVASLPPDTVAFGDHWLSSRRSSLLRVPSRHRPEQRQRPDRPVPSRSATIRISAMQPITFDRRLWPSAWCRMRVGATRLK